jgi:hypothetical protein
MAKTMTPSFPKTGRIGRLVKILQSETEEKKSSDILTNASEYDSFSPENKSDWWRMTIKKMEQVLGKEKAIHVMMSCGAKCCGTGQRKTAKRLFLESDSISAFLDKISTHDVKEGDLKYILQDNNTIIAEHNKCFCRQVSKFKEAFDTETYCQCSVEFNKQFFTAAFGKGVQVELLQSIISGAKSCKFKVTIPGGV